jgi:hypothetical protein
MIKIINNGRTIAIIITAEFQKDGIHFFTPSEYSQQLAFMKRPGGYIVSPHTHNLVPREVINTLETLFIRKGKVRVDFYSEEKEFIESYELKTGDVILLVSGGHGFEMLEETEMIEVKQGPFLGDQDKVRF